MDPYWVMGEVVMSFFPKRQLTKNMASSSSWWRLNGILNIEQLVQLLNDLQWTPFRTRNNICSGDYLTRASSRNLSKETPVKSEYRCPKWRPIWSLREIDIFQKPSSTNGIHSSNFGTCNTTTFPIEKIIPMHVPICWWWLLIFSWLRIFGWSNILQDEPHHHVITQNSFR